VRTCSGAQCFQFVGSTLCILGYCRHRMTRDVPRVGPAVYANTLSLWASNPKIWLTAISHCQRMAFHSVWLPSGAKNAMRSVYWLAAYQAYPPAKMPEVWLNETQMDWFILLAPRAPMSTPICQDQSWHVRDMMKTLGTPWAADRFKQSFQTSETLHFLRSRCQRFPQLAAGLPKHRSTPNNWHDWHVSDICVYL